MSELYKRSLAITDRLAARPDSPALLPQIAFDDYDRHALRTLVRAGTVIEEQAWGLRAGTLQYRLAGEHDDKHARFNSATEAERRRAAQRVDGYKSAPEPDETGGAR